MRYILLTVLISFSSISASSEDKVKELSIHDIMKMDVSNNEDIIRKTTYASYIYGRGMSNEEWEKTLSDRLNKLNKKYINNQVRVDFDSIGTNLNDTILKKYNELTNTPFPAEKQKLLKDKIRWDLPRRYMQMFFKSYVKMKNNNYNIESCSNIEDSTGHGVFPATICLKSFTGDSAEYNLFVPTDKEMNKTKSFGMFYNKNSDGWILSKIVLNENNLDDNFFMFLSYIK